MSDFKIETDRLLIRKAVVSDAEIKFIVNLWNNPQVMKFVGFPMGLNMTAGAVEKQISNQSDTEYNSVLLVMENFSGKFIGNCKLSLPDEDNIAGTDVKISPEYWGNGYGLEIKRALVDYLFCNTACDGVKGDPNKENIASIKMQERVGGVRIKEFVHHFPEHMKSFTTDVHGYVYIVYRKDN